MHQQVVVVALQVERLFGSDSETVSELQLVGAGRQSLHLEATLVVGSRPSRVLLTWLRRRDETVASRCPATNIWPVN